MIQVTLNFTKVEEAIAALGKLMGAAPVAKVATISTVTPATPAAAEVVAPTKRKPRADAGKVRGAYKNAEAPTEGGAKQAAVIPEPVASAPSNVEAPPPAGSSDGASPEQSPAVASAPIPKQEELVSATEALLAAVGLERTKLLMKEHGAEKLRELTDEKKVTYLAAALAEVEAVKKAAAK
jgi:hypothetical protein